MDLPKAFSTYLKLQGYSPVTVRNYVADLNHFLAWLELALKSQNITLKTGVIELIIHYFDKNYLIKYQNFLIKNQFPVSTVNRRLSTLRTFGKFCLSQGWLKENPAKKINNLKINQYPNPKTKEKNLVEKILEEFKKHLEDEKTQANTIKNYLSDIREFLNFINWTN